MLLGVDAGGTSTRAVLVDESGRCLGYGTAGGGNPVSWGPQRAAAQIAAAARDAVARSRSGDGVPDNGVADSRDDGDGAGDGSGDGVPVSGVADGGDGVGDGARERHGRGIAVLAMAGGSAFAGSQVIQDELIAAGLDVTVSVASDLLATFCAGTAALDGYAVVAGTGAAAVRVRRGEVDSSVDGLGWLLGDAGSGFWIGHRVVRAALAGLDGRGPSTTLTPLVMHDLGIAGGGGPVAGRPAELQAAVDVLYRRRPVELSRFAGLAFRAADPGEGGQADPVAAAILDAARDRLVRTLDAVRTGDVTGPVVLGGGIARRLPGLVDAIARSGGTGPATVITVTDGAVGAGVLALRQAGVTVDDAVFARLADTVGRYR